MKIFFVLAFLTIGLSLNAQSNSDSNNMDQQLQDIQQKYNLNTEQTEKVKLLLLDKQTSVDNVMTIKQDTRVANAKQYEINKNFHTSLNEVLTEEQIIKFKEAQRQSRINSAKESKNGGSSKMSSQSNAAKKNN